MHARLRGPKQLNNSLPNYKQNLIPLLSLADETAEPRPGMNIKVAAFTVNENVIPVTQLVKHFL